MTLQVVSQRVTPARTPVDLAPVDLAPVDLAPAAAAGSGRDPILVSPTRTIGSPMSLDPLPPLAVPPSAVGTDRPGTGPVDVPLPVPVEDRLPVLDRRPRRFARLLALVRRRRVAGAWAAASPVPGRHRPDTLRSRGWSMFVPGRRGRRRSTLRL